MHVISVVGARPQFVKLAPIEKEFSLRGIEHSIIHTGQHYDHNMSQQFFDELQIHQPEWNLNVGSKSHGTQTAEMIVGIEKILLENLQACILVYGDTNSTLAATLAAIKLQLPVVHLEAGLRSFNREMPEEHNRVLTDHAADLLLAPTQVALRHLQDEGLGARSVLVGDVMVDVCLETARKSSFWTPPLDLESTFFLATIHRAENTDDPIRLSQIVKTLAKLKTQVLLTAHPRLVAKCKEFDISLDRQSIKLVEPFAYRQMVRAIQASSGIITDSGGLQKEAFLLKRPCVTFRTETEWVETVDLGVNLISPNATASEIENFLLARNENWPPQMPYGSGDAASKVFNAISNFWENRK